MTPNTVQRIADAIVSGCVRLIDKRLGAIEKRLDEREAAVDHRLDRHREHLQELERKVKALQAGR